MASNIQVVGVRFEKENAEFIEACKEKNNLSKNKVVNLIIEKMRQESNGEIPTISVGLVGK